MNKPIMAITKKASTKYDFDNFDFDDDEWVIERVFNEPLLLFEGMIYFILRSLYLNIPYYIN